MTLKKYSYAAFTYVGSALLTILLILLLGGTPERFKAEAPYLLIGLPFIFLFGFIIYNGSKWSFAKWFTRILTIFAGIRSAIFIFNATGINPHFDFKSFNFQMKQSTAALQPLFLINGIVVAIAVLLLLEPLGLKMYTESLDRFILKFVIKANYLTLKANS
jgi:hypothetical protein